MLNVDVADVVIPGELIDELSRAYQTVVDYCDQWKVLSDQDHRAGFECYIPTFGDDDNQRYSFAAQEDAVADAVALTIDETLERKWTAGIICASEDTVSVVEYLNAAKKAFKETVLKIRNLSSAKKTGSREAVLKQAMKSAGIQTLHLRECYRLIRIMPRQLESFSWTWATSHARIQRLSFDEAMALAEGLRDRNGELADTAVDILERRCSPDQPLVRRVTLPNQLRANYVYREDGNIVRKSCPISGAVIAQQPSLPRLAWRNNPMFRHEMPLRLQRESTIEPEPIIQSLSIYRYVNGHT